MNLTKLNKSVDAKLARLEEVQAARKAKMAQRDELPQEQKPKPVDDGQNIGAGEKPVHPDALAYKEHEQKAKLAKALAGNVDEALWDKAKRASQEAFGEIRWPFVNWWYNKQGGK